MGKRYVLVDDYDGKELPEDTAPVSLSLGRTTYNLYLSEDNHGKLLETLEPFIKDAETAKPSGSDRAPRNTTSGGGTADKEKLKAVRAWAQSTGFKYKNAKGEDVTLGDRGRIPAEVVKAYEEANE
jgi:hypothetical protein